MKRSRSQNNNKLPNSKKQKISHNDSICPDIEDSHILWKSYEQISDIQLNLIQWYDTKEERDMPWRLSYLLWEKQKQDINDIKIKEQILTQRAYEVWVSEVMLQQTRVQTVIEYYKKWMKIFPTITKLASASLEDVNQLWAGLGYYRRAKYLHLGAQKIINEYNGIIPNTFNELLKLPGIGKYTAGAISSIVFNETSPVVDGNVIRVLSRLNMISDDPKLSKTQKLFWELSKQVIPDKRTGCFNQALMDLGSTLCTVKNPNCSQCPLNLQCNAYQSSLLPNSDIQVTQYPTKVKKTLQRLETVSTCIFYYLNTNNNKYYYLIVQRPSTGLLASMWEFPTIILDNNKTILKKRKQLQIEYLNKTLEITSIEENKKNSYKIIGTINHEFSHIKQTLIVDSYEIKQDKIKYNKDNNINIKWIKEEEIKISALSKGMIKCFLKFIEQSKSKQTQIGKYFN